jgi:hypothetical protein
MAFAGTKLAPKHILMAYMRASGVKQVEIARRLEMSPNQVHMICSSPLFQLQVSEIQKQIRDGAVEDVLDMIRLEGPASVKKLVDLRDDLDAEANIQLSAANSLLDRGAAPKKHQVEEDRTLRIVIGRDEAQLMRAVVKEAGYTIDVTPRGRLLAMVPDGEDGA